MSKFFITRSSAIIGLILLVFSSAALAIKPANVVVLVDMKEMNQQQTINMLYSETWEMLEGEFDVRFTTPRISKVDEVYTDKDVDLVVAMGKLGANTIQQRNAVEIPTIVVVQTAGNDGIKSANNVTGLAPQNQESSQTFIKRVVVALRDKLRNK